MIRRRKRVKARWHHKVKPHVAKAGSAMLWPALGALGVLMMNKTTKAAGLQAYEQTPLLSGVTDELGKLFGTTSDTVAQLQTQAEQLEAAVKTQLALSAVTAIATTVLVAVALAKSRSAQPVRVTVRQRTRKGR